MLPGGHLLVQRRARQAARTGFSALEDQIMWSRLLSVVEEQARTLVRTAFSTPVREAGDLSAGVFDLRGRMLAQAVTGTPGHVNAMAASVGCFLRDHPVETLREGDVLVTNDPWEGTGHLNDFTVVTPAFLTGRLVALFAATSHIADVGGRGFGADANQVFEEGIRIPIGYLIRAGEVDATLMRMVRANVREPDVAQGDLYSLAACNETGCERLVAMMTEFGLDSLDDLADKIVAASRRAMLERIRALRPGTYRHRMTIDGYDEDLELVCSLVVGPDGIRIDFDGTSPQSPYGINVPVTYTRAYASFGVRCVVGSEVPNNAGSLSAIDVTAPEGCLLNAPPPAAVSARHSIGQMLPDVVLGCARPGDGAGLGACGGRIVPVEPGDHGRAGAGRLVRLRRRGALCGQSVPHRRHRRASRQGRAFRDRVPVGGPQHADRDHRDRGAAHLLAEGVHPGFGRSGRVPGRPGAGDGDLARRGRGLRRLQDVRAGAQRRAGAGRGRGWARRAVCTSRAGTSCA